MPYVAIIVHQKEPIKGYEGFAIVTKKDGTFEFKNLYPRCTYELAVYPVAVGGKPYKTMSVETAPKSETKLLSEPIVIRFKFSPDNSTAVDTATGLMWLGNPNIFGNLNWAQAMESAKKINAGGYSDWRLPTKNELSSLIRSLGTGNSIGYLNSIGFSNIVDNWFWTKERSGQLFYGPQGSWVVSPTSGAVDMGAEFMKYSAWYVRKAQ